MSSKKNIINSDLCIMGVGSIEEQLTAAKESIKIINEYSDNQKAALKRLQEEVFSLKNLILKEVQDAYEAGLSKSIDKSSYLKQVKERLSIQL